MKFIVRHKLRWLTSPSVALAFGESFFRLLGMRCKGREIDLLSQVKRVLIVRLDEIGDVVMTTPFLRELRRNLPDAWMTLVVKPAVYNLVERCPYVDEVLTYDWSVAWTKRASLVKVTRHSRAIRLALKRLWWRNFDLAILPRFDIDYYHGNFLAYFSLARWRVGYSEDVTEDKRIVNKGSDRLLTHPVKVSNHIHEVERNLDLIRFLGGTVGSSRLETWLSTEDERVAENVLTSNGVNPVKDTVIAFCLGAGQAKRIWPVDRFIKVARWVKEKYSAMIIVIGGKDESGLGHRLRQEIGENVVNMAGRTTLRETTALLKRCVLYVGNDTGPMHIAAAVGTPVVGIFCHPLDGDPLHSNSPARFGPWKVFSCIVQPHVPMSPCSDACMDYKPHCILNVSVEQVCEAISIQLDTVLKKRRERIQENSL
ncbi:glycosyltransferase family 9 protein [Pyrinomonas methylaliphatogenes]|nr:glycosyltransferase family 9 protein [Pyrinomonas methylaliphatogenes]